MPQSTTVECVGPLQAHFDSEVSGCISEEGSKEALKSKAHVAECESCATKSRLCGRSSHGAVL